MDPSLIAHYFGDKSGLLTASMELPFNPAQHFAEISAPGPDGLGERLVRRALGVWDDHPDTISTLLRTSIGSAGDHLPFADLVRAVMVPTVAAVLTGENRELRASMLASHVVGFAVLRYVLRIEPLASATIDEAAELYAPALQRLIDGR